VIQADDHLAAAVAIEADALTHSKEQIGQIARSIEEWGWTVPVLIDEDGGLIAGHGRILAAKKLKIEEVPVVVARGWSEAQRRAYVLADTSGPRGAPGTMICFTSRSARANAATGEAAACLG
jgi:ParB-like chromosome segregation protein Spo0J